MIIQAYIKKKQFNKNGTKDSKTQMQYYNLLSIQNKRQSNDFFDDLSAKAFYQL